MKDGISAVERIRLAIENGIQVGEFTAGQRLTEAALTKKLNVSRGPLREAMHLLQGDGLIEIHPNKGAVVRALTRKDLAEFFQLRSLFEALAAGRCARRIDEDGVRDTFVRLREEAAALQRGEHPRDFAEHDADLHAALIKHANNATLEDHWRRLQMPVMRLRFLGNLNTIDVAQSAAEHMELLGHILDGNEAGAEAASRAHVARLNGIVQRMGHAEFDRLFRFAKDRRA